MSQIQTNRVGFEAGLKRARETVYRVKGTLSMSATLPVVTTLP